MGMLILYMNKSLKFIIIYKYISFIISHEMQFHMQ